MRNGNYEDRETISQVIEKYLPDYDLSKSENGPSLAYSLAERIYGRTAVSVSSSIHLRYTLFKEYFNHPDQGAGPIPMMKRPGQTQTR